jgi:hypothetical protein
VTSGGPRFLVARNPDPNSTLPYLIRLPLGPDGLVLRAKETWPRTAKVYCYRGNDPWPADADVVDDVAVRTCSRRGVSVDLVLARGKENRSQFVFTTLKGGREAIFWQTARTNRTAKPNVRVPGRRASWLDDLVIVVDTRERYGYRFAAQQTDVRKAALPVGDYGVLDAGGALVAVVERKNLADLTKGLVEGSLAFRLADLAAQPRAAVVVEDRYSALFKSSHVGSGRLADLLARHQVRYPEVPIVFCETRPLAEEWTFRFLGAALAQHLDQPEDPTAPRRAGPGR